MKQSKLLIPTLREAPAEADAISHKLLLRAGYIRQVASGIYTYLPLGWRVLQKVSAIVREEMDQASAQEVLMPVMQPVELWQESGRYGAYGPELMRLQDRHQREFALGPTHEEVVTSLVGNEVKSYRQLPLTLYQIQTKFRDERRPRFGLLRGREFLMKDAYSFDMDIEGLNETYWRMYDAYQRIFERCGINVKPVEADAGTIGGEGGTHEFMALADIGEDTIVTCPACDYAANLEKASIGEAVQTNTHGTTESSQNTLAYERFHTPNVGTIQELVNFTGHPASEFVKTLIYKADDMYIAVLVRGDYEINEIKLKHALGAETLDMADAAATERITGAPVGYAGPVGLSIPIWADRSALEQDAVIVGANEQHYHLRNVQLQRDAEIAQIGDYRNAVEGDCCPRCGEALKFYRGIEVGQVFKLGTKYSCKLGAVYLDQTGAERDMVMGCYGVGISRVLSAIAEQHHDDHGILWPMAVAPYQVHVIIVSTKDQVQCELGEVLVQQLEAAGVEVLLDDRDERPGVKFKDADLIGIPLRITIGKRAGEQIVEYKERGEAQAESIDVQAAVARVMNTIGSC
ncbi:proline--tRNA ligase [Paenibacillus marinisediminis]